MIFGHYREIVTPEETERYWRSFRRRGRRMCRWRGYDAINFAKEIYREASSENGLRSRKTESLEHRGFDA
jgi:hypothetical protein